MDEIELKDLLLKESPEFRKLHGEHQACEKRLEILAGKGFLTDEERLEEREIKKRKLALKDRMYVLMTQFRGGR